jgi:hypothetical protein
MVTDAPLRCFTYFVPLFGGKNLKHFYALFEDRNWRFHFVKILLLLKKALSALPSSEPKGKDKKAGKAGK